MECPKCQIDNTDDRRFCGECGTRLPFGCASCGFLNQPGIKFCGGCGHNLPEPAPPLSAASTGAEPKAVEDQPFAITSEGKVLTCADEAATCRKVYYEHLAHYFSISGSKGRDKRPALNNLLKDANRRKFDLVAAWSVDLSLPKSLSGTL